jgi:heme A synthase
MAGVLTGLSNEGVYFMKVSTYKAVSGNRSAISGRSFLAKLSLVTLISVILVIAVGSLVRVTGHGLGCPDWPLCYGQAIPPLKLGAWVEFSHRLVAGVVGLQVLGLVILAWRHFRHDGWVFVPAMAAGAFLLLQVWLGGSHVLNELPVWTGFVHTAVAMLIAGLVAVPLAVSHPTLRRMEKRAAELLPLPRLSLWATITVVATFALLVTGSLVTRSGASLACPAFPHCGFVTVPDYLRYLVTLQMIHRYTAFAVAAAVVLLVYYLLRYGRGDVLLRRYAYLLLALVVIQFALGISNVLLALPLWSRILHLTIGGLIWVAVVMLAVILYGAGRRLPQPEAT